MSPTIAHYKLTGRLDRAVGGFVDEHDLGLFGPELSVLFASNPDTVLIPDLAFIPTTDIPPEEQHHRLSEVVPTFVIEVLSPSNTAQEMDEKIQIYLRAGVRLVWIVNPRRRSVTVYAGDGTVQSVLPGGVLDGGDVLPGFALPVDRIFA